MEHRVSMRYGECLRIGVLSILIYINVGKIKEELRRYISGEQYFDRDYPDIGHMKNVLLRIYQEVNGLDAMIEIYIRSDYILSNICDINRMGIY